MADTIRDWLVARYPSKKAESPLEHLFHAACEFMGVDGRNGMAGKVRVSQQAAIGNYRADFLFEVQTQEGKWDRLVVEIDGHEYHERTKEQAARDKARDRYMTGEGIHLMRFAGTEVWGNPFACVDEVSRRCFRIRFGEDEKQAGWRAFRQEMDALFADCEPRPDTSFGARFGKKG
jgi:very-short-patch-repair endonuclease